MYGYNPERTRSAPFQLRPPFAGLWSFKTNGNLEPPPVIAYGIVFLTTTHGVMYAIDAHIGRILWRRHFANCIAASPAVAGGTLYLPLMHKRPCVKNAPGSARRDRRAERQDGQRRNGASRRAPSSLRRCSSGASSTSAPGTGGSTPSTCSGSGTVWCGATRSTTRWSARPRIRTEPSTWARTAVGSTRFGRARVESAGARRRFPASAGVSTSTQRLRLPTAASSSGTQTERSMPSAQRPVICSGRGRRERTSTQPPRSGGIWCSSGPGTATSRRSTCARAISAGDSTRRRDHGRVRAFSTVSSTSRRTAGSRRVA